MSIIIDEFKEWNTPVIGSYLLWQFSLGYYENHKDKQMPTLIHEILAFPLLFSKVYSDRISNRLESISDYVRKFTETKDSDLLLSYSNKVSEYKVLVMKSIDIAISLGFIGFDSENALIIPIDDITSVKGSKAKLEPYMSLGKKAKILGKWFSEENLSTLTAELGVVL